MRYCGKWRWASISPGSTSAAPWSSTGSERNRCGRREAGPAPGDAAGGVDGHGAAAVELHGLAQGNAGGIVAVGQHRAAHHPSGGRRVHGATRSSSRKRRMRSTLVRARARSVAAGWSIRSSNAARIASLVAPFTAKMNGKPNRLR